MGCGRIRRTDCLLTSMETEKSADYPNEFRLKACEKSVANFMGLAAVQSGDTVSLSEITGLGVLIPKLDLFSENANVISVSGSLGSKAGVGISFESLDEPLEVPVGDWHIEILQIEVADDNGVYTFAFARSGVKSLISIADSEEKELNLLGELTLSAKVNSQTENEKSTLTLTPFLNSASGCYLTNSKTGKSSAINDNRLTAYNETPQQELATGSSGFS